MLAHVPSFGRNPRGSADFLAYPVPKACMHVLGTRVPRRLAVARSASSPKAAQALLCSLIPGLRISFGRVTCMARAASVPGLWALGLLLLCGVCVWVRVAVGCGFCQPRQSWLGSWVGVFGHGLWCCPSFAGCLWFVVGLRFRPAFGTCVVACALRLPPAVSGSGVRCGRACCGLGFGCAPPLLGGVLGCVCARAPVPCGLLHLLVGVAVRGCVFVRAPRLFPAFPGWGAVFGRACWARVSAVPRPSWLGCRGVFFALFFLRTFVWLCGVGCWVSQFRALWPLSPHPLSFGLGGWLFFFFVLCVCMFRCPFSRWAAVPGLVLLVLPGWSPRASLGVLSLVPSGWGVGPPLVVLAGGLVAVGCFHAPPPLPPLFFSFFLGGVACLFLPLPSLGWRAHWPAFSVVFRAAVGGCVLLGRVPAPGIGWAMYTLGSAPLPAGLGPGSAGWAAAPGGCVSLWVRGLGLFVSFLLCGAGFNFLGGPPPLLPGARWPRVWPAVPVCGLLVRRLPGCAVACFG